MDAYERILPELCCPGTRSALRRASEAELAELRREHDCDDALVSEAGIAYPVVDGIPLLLPDEGIPLQHAVDSGEGMPPSSRSA